MTHPLRFVMLAIGLLLGVVPRGDAADAEPVGMQRSESGIRHSFLVTGSRTMILDEECRVVWEAKEKSRDGFVLENGNVLYSNGKEAKEVTRDGELVFKYTLSAGNKELGTAVRLADGVTMLVERGPQPQIVEVVREGKVLSTTPLKPDSDNAHMQTRMARKLKSGNYLVPHLLAFAVKEYTPQGEVVRTIRTDLEELGGRKAENWPFTAILLDNGNILVNLTHGNKTVEFDNEGKVVWRVDNSDVANRFADPCGGQRLPNGNTVICSYGQGKPDMPKVFEVTRDKAVVWEYVNPSLRGIHEIHVLTTNGKPIAGNPLK
ncbi:MAG: hypothetical protein R3C01_09905 [Planctomycetaceae bacterium]